MESGKIHDMKAQTVQGKKTFSERAQMAILMDMQNYVNEAAKDNPNKDVENARLNRLFNTIQKYKKEEGIQ